MMAPPAAPASPLSRLGHLTDVLDRQRLLDADRRCRALEVPRPWRAVLVGAEGGVVTERARGTAQTALDEATQRHSAETAALRRQHQQQLEALALETQAEHAAQRSAAQVASGAFFPPSRRRVGVQTGWLTHASVCVCVCVCVAAGSRASARRGPPARPRGGRHGPLGGAPGAW